MNRLRFTFSAQRTLLVLALFLAGGILLGRDQPVGLPPHAAALPTGVIYLAPADHYLRQLYLADLERGVTVQLTDAPNGVDDFAASPDGTQVAHTRNHLDGTADVWLLDLSDPIRTARPVTHCVNAVCYAPAWSPDGTRIAYQRDDYNAGPGTGVGPGRVWIVDLATLDTRLLFDDPAMLGEGPIWSPAGNRIAVFDPGVQGIRLHPLDGGDDILIASAQGLAGRFSPDGQQLVYPVLVRGLIGETFYTHLGLFDLASETFTALSGTQTSPVDDSGGVWSLDGRTLLIARRALDERYTPGRQIYLFDPATGQADLLVFDPEHTHSVLSWDASGRRIAYQRFALQNPDALPEVWVYDLETGEATRIAENAFLPAWVP